MGVGSWPVFEFVSDFDTTFAQRDLGFLSLFWRHILLSKQAFQQHDVLSSRKMDMLESMTWLLTAIVFGQLGMLIYTRLSLPK